MKYKNNHIVPTCLLKNWNVDRDKYPGVHVKFKGHFIQGFRKLLAERRISTASEKRAILSVEKCVCGADPATTLREVRFLNVSQADRQCIRNIHWRVTDFFKYPENEFDAKTAQFCTLHFRNGYCYLSSNN